MIWPLTERRLFSSWMIIMSSKNPVSIHHSSSCLITHPLVCTYFSPVALILPSTSPDGGREVSWRNYGTPTCGSAKRRERFFSNTSWGYTWPQQTNNG